MSDKYIVTIDIDAKGKKNKIKYFLINKTKRKLHNLINIHTKTHKPYKTITGGTKGQTDKPSFNPSALPFNPFGTLVPSPSQAATVATAAPAATAAKQYRTADCPAENALKQRQKACKCCTREE